MATKTKTPTATARDRELLATHEEANAKLEEARTRAAANRGRLARLRQDLDQRAVSDPDEFGPTGEPLPDTAAAKLADKIGELGEADGFARVIRGCEQRVDQTRMALFQHHQHHAEALLEELEPEARQVVDEFEAWAKEGEPHYRRLVEVGGKAQQIVARQPSAEQGRLGLVPDYEEQRRLLKALGHKPTAPLPRNWLARIEAERAEQDGDDQDEADE